MGSQKHSSSFQKVSRALQESSSVCWGCPRAVTETFGVSRTFQEVSEAFHGVSWAFQGVVF